MAKRLTITGFLLAAGLVASFMAPGAARGESCVSTQCHPNILKAKHVHPAAESCEACHQSVAAPHPQKKKATFKLLQEVPGLCSQCHAPLGTMKHVHAPVKNGMCTSCHNPHGSNESKLLARPAHELCLTCHGDKGKGAFMHGPAATGDCLACHGPHESKNAALVLKDGAELCFACHVDMQNVSGKKHVHPALAGGCTSCHNPHGSPAKKLLAADGVKLCFQCHPAIEEKVTKSRTTHQPVTSGKGCASCHDPHSSDAEKLLPRTGKELCLECHKKIIQKNETVLHGPIRDGKCVPCHDPHGSGFATLLIKDYNPGFYVPYTDKEYALCFHCHNRDLLRYPTTSYATGFRDGDRNLHYLHVNIKDKGRSCKACHLVHAGGNQKLIAEKTPFGKWNLPLRFTKTDTGGSCAPGCHQKVNYDRKTPGRAVPSAKPAREEVGKAGNR